LPYICQMSPKPINCLNQFICLSLSHPICNTTIPMHSNEPTVQSTGECYLPTLLHFASVYGLRELTSKLLHCPLAIRACRTRNSNNMTPEQMAHHLNHTDIAALLRDFERLCETHKSNILYDSHRAINGTSVSGCELTDQQKASLKTLRYSTSSTLSAHHHLYGLRLYSDLLHIKQNSNELYSNCKEYENNVKTSSSSISDEAFDTTDGNKHEMNNEIQSKGHSLCSESIPDLNDNKTANNALQNWQQLSRLNEQNLIKKVNNSDAVNGNNCGDNEAAIESPCDLNDSQKELLAIMDVFRTGISFVEFETLFDDWQQKYCKVLKANVSPELDDSLTQIRNLCEIGRKRQDFETNKHSLNFNDLRYYLNSKLNNKLNDSNLKVFKN
jgi:hypothetical protein